MFRVNFGIMAGDALVISAYISTQFSEKYFWEISIDKGKKGLLFHFMGNVLF